MTKRTTPKSVPLSEFDREFVIDTFGVPPPEAQARWQRAKRGRPRRGEGARVVSVSIERNLLARSDALAAKLGVTRATLVARGLKAVLAVEGES